MPDPATPLPGDRDLLSESDTNTFYFPRDCAVTISLRGTDTATVSVTLPGGLPFAIVCSQSYALGRALSEAIAYRRVHSG